MSFMFGFNTILYQDDDIKKRANMEIDKNVYNNT